ncbi:peptidoglycan-binding protein [Amycolatopsis sp. NPDC049252]|uniref:peptidoglycan-binding domain-containing protein n=1 Tax=Amycolatopsis sp. NPDC049252 TaxID=3363933 RepID=UPI00371B1B87
MHRILLAALVAGTAAALAPATALAAGPGWLADLTTGNTTTNLSQNPSHIGVADPSWRQGYAIDLLAVHPLGAPADRVDAQVTADTPKGTTVEVDVRGRLANGRWTEWTGAGTRLASAVSAVQARITLQGNGSASPTVSAVRLTPAGGSAPQAEAAGTPLTYRVFATREGLVGATTANGHVIKSRDHFVALPSGRALSPKGSTEYSVKLCNPANGRCEVAPVWDVGPWNTKDDYWNPASTRQSWKTLAQGRPEAQAAYQDGFNGGKDQYGRTVGNPAGIDLADGTFWDGLGLQDNGWVEVTYQWTGAGTPAPSWPVVRDGDTGDAVKSVQYLLNSRQSAGLAVDGEFGPATLAATKAFQSAHGLTVDGIVGPDTWAALVPVLTEGSTGDAVRAVQNELTAHDVPTTITGTFDADTAANLRTFQTAHGLSPSGSADADTWKALVS